MITVSLLHMQGVGGHHHCHVVTTQEVGRRLMEAATHGTDLVVVAEALDALFDVFADDATDPVAQSLQLTQRLQSILPQLKAKVKHS